MENRQFPLVYHDFNSYVADWPEAEASRAWDTNSGKRPAKLMQAQGHGNSMPGGYYWLSVVEYRTSRNAPLAYGVRIHDCDDGSCSKDATSQLEADAQLEEVLKLAPSSMREICALAGFYWD
jgi:hypothetical protein